MNYSKEDLANEARYWNVSTQNKSRFQIADDIAQKKFACCLKTYFTGLTQTAATKVGERWDFDWTAVTENGVEYFSGELKDRKNRYTYELFLNAPPNSTLAEGMFIDKGKADRLLKRRTGDSGETRTVYFIENFPDGYTAFWRIDDNTPFNHNMTPKYYAKHTVAPENGKKVHRPLGLRITDATFVMFNDYERGGN